MEGAVLKSRSLKRPSRFTLLALLALPLAMGYGRWGAREKAPVLSAGFGIGLGLSSISQGDVSLGERPGGITATLETVYGPHWSVAFDHTRSFGIMPLTSNVSFTGFTMRYYWDTPYPKPELDNEPPYAQSHWFETKRSPYFGFGAGYAEGAIGKIIENTSYGISGDGPYWTMRVGADYPWGPNRVYRLEFGISSVIGAVGGVSMVTLLWGVVWGM
jgi:hypothetical protein